MKKGCGYLNKMDMTLDMTLIIRSTTVEYSRTNV